mgnify:CR=1 FL=1
MLFDTKKDVNKLKLDAGTSVCSPSRKEIYEKDKTCLTRDALVKLAHLWNNSLNQNTTKANTTKANTTKANTTKANNETAKNGNAKKIKNITKKSISDITILSVNVKNELIQRIDSSFAELDNNQFRLYSPLVTTTSESSKLNELYLNILKQ